MAVVVKVGEIYPCGDMRSGEGNKGAWAFFPVRAKKGYDKIKIWASNPGEIRNAASVQIVSIDAVELKAYMNNQTQKWEKDFSATCTLKQMETNRAKQGVGTNFTPTSEDELNELFGLNF